MMIQRLFALALLITLAACQSAPTQTAIGSYAQHKAGFEKDLQAKGGIPDAALAIMQTSADNLANTLPEPGLTVGTVAPTFTLQNAFGHNVSLKQTLTAGPVVLVFYRGSWCPYCNLHLRALQESAQAFAEHQAQVLLITPQTPDHSLAQVRAESFPFQILSDLDYNTMKAYNVFFDIDQPLLGVYEQFGIDLENHNGEQRTALPVPATFIINEQGVIHAAHADLDYKARMEPAAIIAALKPL